MVNSPPLVSIDRTLTGDSLATDTSKGNLSSSNLQSRIKRYENAKSLSLRNGKYILENSPMHSKMATNVITCGSQLTFHNYFNIDEIRLVSAHFCKKHLVCPMCARRRSAKQIGTMLMRYERILSQHPFLKPYLVTKTVRNQPDLLKVMKHLKNSEHVFRKRRNRKNTPSESHKIHSGVMSFETTKNVHTGEWHPHSHSIVLCTEEPDQWALSEEWHRITGDSYIVDVSEVDNTDPIKAFLELFKYVTKFHELDAKTTFDLYLALTGMRLISVFGGFYGMKIEPEQLTDEDLRDSQPYIELVYRYINDSYQQI